MMEQLTDSIITKRLKATLANFHSYCQKRSLQNSEIKQVRSKSNKSITKYRSTRELRKTSQSKLHPYKNLIKKKEENLTTGQLFQMKTSDLIEIIKIKLNRHQEMRVKTDANQSKNQAKSYMLLKKFNSNQSKQCNKSFNLNDTIKRKKINLLVQNSKKNSQKATLNQRKIESFNITLQNRPFSAIIKPSQFATQPQEIEKQLKYKYSCEILRKYQNKSSLLSKNDSRKKKEVLSGWDLPHQEDFLSIQNINQLSQDKKRKKSQ